MFQLRFYRDAAGRIPAKEWLSELQATAKAKGFAKLKLLAEEGNKLRRPHADYLRDGIYELRWRIRRVNYRLLYFFSGKRIIILSHGLTKTGRVLESEIDLAVRRKRELKS